MGRGGKVARNYNRTNGDEKGDNGLPRIMACLVLLTLISAIVAARIMKVSIVSELSGSRRLDELSMKHA